MEGVVALLLQEKVTDPFAPDTAAVAEPSQAPEDDSLTPVAETEKLEQIVLEPMFTV